MLRISISLKYTQLQMYAMRWILNWLFVFISQQELLYPAVYRLEIHSMWIYGTLKPTNVFCIVVITSDHHLFITNSFCSDNSLLTDPCFHLLSFLLMRYSISCINLMLGKKLASPGGLFCFFSKICSYIVR